ncbi:MAG: hypothetical protein LBV06_10250 [Propionibacteriaceae bacterium]|jgi:uncharacterized protein YjdB|nr:hypothetical protein [Propionibacteriaceae bacterium]
MMSTRFSRVRRCVLGLTLSLSLLAALAPWNGDPVPAQAVPASQWKPGMIISDADFYNSGAMSAAQVQGFLDQKGQSCRDGEAACIKNFRESTSTRAADSYCGRYVGASNETAAQIITKVSQACGINPQVLIVTLQKENSLITRSQPSQWSYRTAMGYGCPDSSGCETAYYGFSNQLYRAARQFKIYAADPGWFSHRANAWNTIAYNPSPSCGSSRVYIENQATASLYNYTPYQPNQAALNNLYGTGDSCSAYGNRNFWSFFNDWFGASAPKPPAPTPTPTPPPTFGVKYSSHVQNVGWQDAVYNGKDSGTTGQSLRLEALKASLIGAPAGSSLTYSTHVQGLAWQAPVSDGAQAGTTGRSTRIEALTMSLSGPIAATHDVWYRVHVEGKGWLGWASNGAPVGTVGAGLRVEAIDIQLRDKGSAPSPTANSYFGPSVSFTGHVQYQGWGARVYDGNVLGTVGQSLRLEAFTAKLSGVAAGSSIDYAAYVEGQGWQKRVSNGATAGTTGQSKRIEAVSLSLSGPAASQYTLWYRVHVGYQGWMSWTSDGYPSGTTGRGLRVEAVQILMVPKGVVPVGGTADPWSAQDLSYKAYVQSKNWQSPVFSGATAGTTGQSRAIEALSVSGLDALKDSMVVYSTHVQNKGWLPPVSNGRMIGNPGSGLRTEAVALSLMGKAASTSDIWYRVHVQGYGWLGWTSNGQTAGSTGMSLRMEAIQILVMPKGVTPRGVGSAAAIGANTAPPSLTAATLQTDAEAEMSAWSTVTATPSVSSSPTASTTVSATPSASASEGVSTSTPSGTVSSSATPTVTSSPSSSTSPSVETTPAGSAGPTGQLAPATPAPTPAGAATGQR